MTHRETIDAYRQMVAAKSERDRMAETKQKTGVFTGGFAINPVNEKRIPVYIADYVLMGYGTGAIMAVPGHDERDYEFARQFNLPIESVVAAVNVASRPGAVDLVADVLPHLRECVAAVEADLRSGRVAG